MINNINTSDPDYIMVTGNYTTPYISPGAVGAGMLRWNPNTKQIEVNDGCVWIEFQSSDAQVRLTDRARLTLQWAESKMAEEQKIEDIIKRNPALKKAKEKYDLIWNIVKNEYQD